MIYARLCPTPWRVPMKRNNSSSIVILLKKEESLRSSHCSHCSHYVSHSLPIFPYLTVPVLEPHSVTPSASAANTSATESLQVQFVSDQVSSSHNMLRRDGHYNYVTLAFSLSRSLSSSSSSSSLSFSLSLSHSLFICHFPCLYPQVPAVLPLLFCNF